MTSRTDLGIKSSRIFQQEFPDGTTRWLEITSAYDLRPGPDGKDYGIHGAEFRFGLQRGGIAVTLLWMTPFYLPETRRKLATRPAHVHYFDGLGDVSYHSPVPLHEGQSCLEECEYTGGRCYSDGSSLASGEIFDAVVKDPEELWKRLMGWLENTEKRVAEARSAERNFT